MRLCGMAAAAMLFGTVCLAGEPPTDPLSLLEHPRHRAAPLSPSTQPAEDTRIDKALEYLRLWQSPDGSWDRLENADPIFEKHAPPPAGIGQRWSSPPYDGPAKDMAEKDTVCMADTCLSAWAMLDAVTRGGHAELSRPLQRAIDRICSQVEFWKADTIYIQTRFLDPIHDQTPAFGEYRYFDGSVDTFLALSFLLEARAHGVKPEDVKRLDGAIDILLGKIEKRQTAQGTWADETAPGDKMRPFVSLPPKKYLLQDFDAEGLNESGTNVLRTDVEGRLIFTEPEYSTAFPNVLSHAVAVKALFQAAREGRTLKPETLARAARYWRQALDHVDWKVLSPKRRAIVATARLSTGYDIDATARQRLAAAKARGAGAAEVTALTRAAAEARGELESAATFLESNGPPSVYGPGLVFLPDAMAALREMRGRTFADTEARVQADLYRREQASDGHFLAGLTRAGRGDSTYGTATSARALLQLSEPAQAAGGKTGSGTGAD